MKLITTKETKKFSPEYGWLKVTTYYFLGIKLFPEYEFLHEPRQQVKPYERHEIEEMTGFQKWCNEKHLNYIDNDTFTQILDSRF